MCYVSTPTPYTPAEAVQGTGEVLHEAVYLWPVYYCTVLYCTVLTCTVEWLLSFTGVHWLVTGHTFTRLLHTIDTIVWSPTDTALSPNLINLKPRAVVSKSMTCDERTSAPAPLVAWCGSSAVPGRESDTRHLVDTLDIYWCCVYTGVDICTYQWMKWIKVSVSMEPRIPHL